MGETKIGWTEYSFNPWWGCTKVSPACGLPLPGHEDEEHGECYALTWSERCGYSVKGSKFPIWGAHEQRRVFGDAHWKEPLRWQHAAEKGGYHARVFCGSMCDILERREDLVPLRQRVFGLVPQTPNLMWLFLTKRPENWDFFPTEWLVNQWPNNVMFGFTAENQEWYEKRIEAVRHVAFRNLNPPRFFLSAEPLLGPINPGNDGLMFDWIICGGESGRGARPMHPDWARGLRDWCAQNERPFFFKQWGEWTPANRGPGGDLFDFTAHVRPSNAGMFDYNERWNHGGLNAFRQSMARVGKLLAGRMLDGVEHNGTPAWWPQPMGIPEKAANQ